MSKRKAEDDIQELMKRRAILYAELTNIHIDIYIRLTQDKKACELILGSKASFSKTEQVDCIFAAIHHNCPQTLELLVRNYNINLNRLINKEDDTPFIAAIKAGHIEIVGSLVKLNASPWIIASYGLHALDVAIEIGNPEMLEVLEQLGINPANAYYDYNLDNDEPESPSPHSCYFLEDLGLNPYHVPFQKFPRIFLSKQLSYDVYLSQIIDLMRKGDEEQAIAKLSGSEIAPADANHYIQYLLIYAISYDCLEVASYLVSLGADPNSRWYLSRGSLTLSENRFACSGTLLHLAAERGYISIIISLCELNAKFNKENQLEIQNGNEFTPLHSAVCEGQIEAVRTLIYLGADVEVMGNEFFRAQDIAVRFNNLKMLLAMEQAGVDLQSSDANDGVSLHTGIEHASIKTIRFLVEEKGLDPNAENSFSEIPIQMSENELGLDILTRANNNKTSLRILNKSANYGHDGLNLSQSELDDLIHNLAQNPITKKLNLGKTLISDEALQNLVIAMETNTNLGKIKFSGEDSDTEDSDNVRVIMVSTIKAKLQANRVLADEVKLLVKNQQATLANFCTSSLLFFKTSVTLKSIAAPVLQILPPVAS